MHPFFSISKHDTNEMDDGNPISDTNESNSESKTDEQNGSDEEKDRNSPGGSKTEEEAHTEAKREDSLGDDVPIDDLERKDFDAENRILKSCNEMDGINRSPNREMVPDVDDAPPGSRTPLYSGIPRYDLPGCSNSNDTIRNMMRRKPLYPVEAPPKKKPVISPEGTPQKKSERPMVRPTFMQRLLSNNVAEAKDIPRGKLYRAESVECVCENRDPTESTFSMNGRTSSNGSSSSDNSKDFSVPSTSNADKLLGLDKRDEPSGSSTVTEEYKYYKDDESDDDSSDVHCCTCHSSHEDEDDDEEEEPGVDERLWRKRRCEPPSPQDLKKFCTDSSPVPYEEETYSGSNPGSNFSSPGSSSHMYRLPEVKQWLQKFLSWPDNEKDEALDLLIGRCSVGQVRYMMKSIEPLLQRDFISLLPKELALTVLGYLEPKDLARAARTCRYWRFLADDNLLWKDQCRRIGITTLEKKSRISSSSVSPWKAAYMRQYLIENNWLHKPVSNAKVMRGHDDHVITCLQFCGNRILSGSDDTTLKIWSSVTGKCLRTLRGHTGGVWSSQMVGDLVISGSTDRTLRIWNANTGRCLNILMGHSSTVRCMHLYKKRVVSGSRDTTLRVWSIPGGKCLSVLSGHLAAVRCVQYDGKVVVSGAYDYFVKVWNPDTGECLHTLAGHKNRVYSLQFDGVHAVSGSLDTTICVWDVASGKLKRTLTGHQSLTSGMELQSNILVSGNADSTVKVWNIATGHCLHTLSGPNKHQSAVTCLQTSNRFVITSSDDGTVKLWDIRTGEFLRNLVELGSGGSGGVVWRIRASATKLICAVGSRNGTEETKLLLLNFDVPGVCEKCKK